VTAQECMRGVFVLVRRSHGQEAGRFVYDDHVPVFVHNLETSLQCGGETASNFQNIARPDGMACDTADFTVEAHTALLQHLPQCTA